MSAQGRRQRRWHRRYQPLPFASITPMVDVMLVLLLIFMITAPLLTVGVEVDLPRTQASALTKPDEPLTVSITADRTVFIQEAEIPVAEVVAKLRAVSENNPDIRIFIRGDKAVDYGTVMEVMGRINDAGFRKVALITDLPERRDGGEN